MTTFYFVRHGESEGNVLQNDIVELKLYGEKGVPLSKKGIKQAKELSKKLRSIPFSAAFASELVRSIETARIIAEPHHLHVTVDSLLDERNPNEYVSMFPDKTKKEIFEEIAEQTKDMSDIEKMRYKHTPKMESAQEAAERTEAFIRKVAYEYENKTVLVVSHGNIMRTFLTYVGWARFDELPGGAIDNTGYFVLETDGFNYKVLETHNVEKQNNSFRIF